MLETPFLSSIKNPPHTPTTQVTEGFPNDPNPAKPFLSKPKRAVEDLMKELKHAATTWDHADTMRNVAVSDATPIEVNESPLVAKQEEVPCFRCALKAS